MLININLLPQKEQDRPFHLIIAGVIVLLAALFTALLFFMAQAEETTQAQLIAESAQLTAEQEAIRQQIGASEGMNEEQQLKETVTWAEGYQFDTLPLLAELVSELPERGFFNNFTFLGPNTATLELQFDTSREAAYYLTQLKSVETIASVTLDSVTNQELILTEDELLKDEETLVMSPRYLATYSLIFVDDRIPVEAAEDGAVVEEGTEQVTEEAPADAPVEPEVTPVETEENTETTPEETEGDAL